MEYGTRYCELIRYRLYLTLLLFVVPLAAIWRLLKRKDTLATFFRRFVPESSSTQNVIWLHAVSLGELNVLAVVLEELRKNSKLEFLITVSNIVALAHAKKTLGDFAHVTVAPLDNSFTLRRFFRIWRPRALITIENEVFANRITFAERHNIPIYFINGRISKRSYARWAKHPSFAKYVFSKISFLWAQDAQTADYFEALGMPIERIKKISNLKRLVQNSQKVSMPERIKREQTLLAASTHPGEEEIVIDAFKLMKSSMPEAFLILAPRHPDRRKEVLKLLQGLNVVLRSTGAPILKDTDVLLADSFHEMDLWYKSASVTLVAGSLKPIGGHTPYEPNQFGSAIIHGPHYSNFEAEYGLLKSANASIECKNAADIAAAWKQLQDKPNRQAIVRRATKILGSPDKLRSQLNQIAQEILCSIQ